MGHIEKYSYIIAPHNKNNLQIIRDAVAKGKDFINKSSMKIVYKKSELDIFQDEEVVIPADMTAYIILKVLTSSIDSDLLSQAEVYNIYQAGELPFNEFWL